MSPTVEPQLLDSAFKYCGELELAIKSLQELSLDSAEQNPNIVPAEETVQNNPTSESTSHCAEYTDLVVMELMNAGSLDDARARASRVLEAFQKENTEALTRQNSILKRAVVIQHRRLNENQRENEDLKQILLQNQENLRNLEGKLLQYQKELSNLKGMNYWLSMHLKQATEDGAVSGSFHHSEVF